ncbi:hypothetical protein QQ045_008560 [Rhodiola kirilowii]
MPSLSFSTNILQRYVNIAKQIEDKSVEEVQAIFNIENDFAEEEAKQKEEYDRAFGPEDADDEEDGELPNYLRWRRWREIYGNIFKTIMQTFAI